MFCAKCGSYTDNGELCAQCAAEENGFIGGFVGNSTPMGYDAPAKKSSVLPLILKVVALVLAILTFMMQYSKLYSVKPKEISERDYEDYMEELEEKLEEELEEAEDLDPVDEFFKSHTSAMEGYEKEEAPEGRLNEQREGYAREFLYWAYLAFILFLGSFFASFYKKNEKAHLLFQGIYFAIMLCAFTLILFATFTGKAYGATFLDDDYYFYTYNLGVSFAWLVAFVASLAGVALTVFSGFCLSKADEEK